MEDKQAQWVPRKSPTGKVLPPLKGPKDKNYPDNYYQFCKYFTCNNHWALSQKAVYKKTLQARLYARAEFFNDAKSDKKKEKSKKSKKSKSGGGVTNLLLTAKVISTIHASQFQEFLEICTVELSESDNIRVAYKQVQAWESTANMALLGVNNGLCPEGVAQVLTFRLKENERKLINAKQADDEYYDHLAKKHESNIFSSLLQILLKTGSF